MLTSGEVGLNAAKELLGAAKEEIETIKQSVQNDSALQKGDGVQQKRRRSSVTMQLYHSDQKHGTVRAGLLLLSSIANETFNKMIKDSEGRIPEAKTD